MRFSKSTKGNDFDMNKDSLHDFLRQIELTSDDTRFDDDGDEI
ncbi:MAG: hypothetical protein RSD67_01405 [Oscillospiraceae bacterium]